MNQSWQQTLDAARAAYLADRPAMEELFYRKHGFVASGSAVAEEIADDLLRMAKDLYENGAYFRLRVVDVFEEARRTAAPARLEIIRPSRSNSRFLLGDVPPSHMTPDEALWASRGAWLSVTRLPSSCP